jgi:type IV pilus assembly protein PilB
VLVPTGVGAAAAPATPAAPADEPAEVAADAPIEAVSVAELKGTTTMQLVAKKLRIGEVLVDMGLIDQGQLDHALRIQQNTGQRLGKVLIAERLVSSTDIAKALARRLAIEYVDIGALPLSDETLELIPPELCTRYDVVPIGEQGAGLLVAMADPTNVFALDDIRLITGRDVRVVVASPDAVDIILSRIVSLDDATGDASIVDEWSDGHVELESITSGDTSGDAAITLVNQIITQGVLHGVSDMHFEPQAEDMVIRFRKDGVLQQVTTVPSKFRNSIASRLKIMANLDISERRQPQDGRVDVRVGDRPIDLRVATLPSVYGESVVLRVVDKSNLLLDLQKLDFLPEQLEKLRHCAAQPYGCLVVAGPTGSGATTPLYGLINELSHVERKIITVEDPVEHRLDGVTQVQVHPKTGLSIAAALTSVMHCDPDVVMIGDMNDHETASIGTQAALTGHLVLAALRTNSAPGAITRLAEMGIEPYLVSSSVLGVLAQRLARRLCTCAEEYAPTREQVFEAGFPRWALDQFDEEPFRLRRPVGCERCAGKGYLGRVGVHEVLLMSKEIAQLAIAHGGADDIAVVAKQQGMTDLWDDGIQKVIQGHTTIEELQRVIQH